MGRLHVTAWCVAACLLGLGWAVPGCGGGESPVGEGPDVSHPPAAQPPVFDTVVDVDGNAYTTVKIGDQWWMAENLRVTRGPAGDPIETLPPGGDEATVQAYGRLYTWDVAMDGASQAGARGICPDGWRVPSDDDWNTLIVGLGGASVAGGPLKEEGTEHWDPPNAGATDTSGFGARAAGGYAWGGFHGFREAVHLWSSSSHGGDAGLPTLHKNETGVSLLTVPKGVASSVRCVR